ncbi:Ribosomal protein L28 [Balamuthia mandrillaris]
MLIENVRSVMPLRMQGRMERALVGGSRTAYGNTITFSHKVNRRRWEPNIHKHHVYSELLGRTLRLKIRNRTLKTIDKYAGLDNYLLRCKEEKSTLGIRLRELMRRAHLIQKGEPAYTQKGTVPKTPIREQYRQFVEAQAKKKAEQQLLLQKQQQMAKEAAQA